MKNYKKTLGFFAVVFLIISSLTVNAADLNLAVVDIADLQSQFMSEINDKLKNEFKDNQLELQNQLNSFKSDSEKFQKNSKTMSKDQVSKVTTDMQQKQLELQQKVQQFDAKIAARRDEELQVKLKVLQTVVNKISEEKKYDMIIAKNAALYVKDKYDITQQVVDRYKKAK